MDYAGGDGEKHKFEKCFNCDHLKEAKAWCESMIPHLIALEICEPGELDCLRKIN
jgi:hypothetical protein